MEHKIIHVDEADMKFDDNKSRMLLSKNVMYGIELPIMEDDVNNEGAIFFLLPKKGGE